MTDFLMEDRPLHILLTWGTSDPSLRQAPLLYTHPWLAQAKRVGCGPSTWKIMTKALKLQPLFFFLRFYLLIYLDRGEGKEKEKEKHQCVVASYVPPTGDLACNSGMCPDWESNQRPFGSQVSAQSTESHQPGLQPLFTVKDPSKKSQWTT